MAYLAEARSSALLPKLIGTYEDELHPVLTQLLTQHYGAVVDIGCAEGYYAVGIARLSRHTTVYAYDLDPRARALCRGLAQQNNVEDRVVVRGRFTPAQLSDLPSGPLLVICDIEGFEIEVFEDSAPHWRDADLIVELHDCLRTGCRDAVQRCLAGSHAIEILPSREKVPPALPALEGLSAADRRLAVAEIRPPQEWLVARRIAR
jgi:SAM-dependent methyltransferase